MIPFNVPFVSGKEIQYVVKAIESGTLCGNNFFGRKCSEKIEEITGTPNALLVPSGTHALEMAALLLNLQEGDEVIMPSFTFVSTATAFLLRGAKVVFVDIDLKTMNISVDAVAQAITKQTRAIVPAHYGGVCCDMDRLLSLAEENDIVIVEDAAQAMFSRYHGKHLGTLGCIGCISFHETKNIQSGEGGAIFINNKKLIERAKIIQEKGTNRSQFIQKIVDKYTWVDIGSSYLMGELSAAFLLAQLEAGQRATDYRIVLWRRYYKNLSDLDSLRLAHISPECQHNAHIFYVFTEGGITERDKMLSYLKKREIDARFHYVALHSSPYGSQHTWKYGDLCNTDQASSNLLRLPMHHELTLEQVDYICQCLWDYYKLDDQVFCFSTP